MVVERDRGVLTKQLDQPLVPRRELAEALHEHGRPHLLVARHAEDAEDVVAAAQDRLAGAEHRRDVLPHVLLDDVADRVTDVVVEAAGAGDHHRRGGGHVEAEVAALEEHCALLRADQRRQLGEDAGDELVDGLLLEQGRAGADDLLEAGLVRLDRAQVAERADGADDGGGQALGRDLRLVAVVVDVVVEHHALLGRVAGLTGSQDDADPRVAELAADPPDQLEAGVLGLHHDVEQDHRDVAVGLEDHAGRGRGADRQDRQRVAVDAQPAEREAGDVVDLRLVVDDQQLPHARAGRLGRLDLVVGEDQEIVVGHGRSGACAGSWIETSVPRPGLDSTAIEPPSRSVTRLWTMCMPSPLPPRPRWVVKKGS